MELPRVYDQQGREQDWNWLTAHFGAISLDRAGTLEGMTHFYRVVELHDSEGPAVQVVNVVDQAGVPLEGIRVVRYWPDAPDLPPWPPPVSRWRERGVYGRTNLEGNIGYGMGHGDYYFPPDGGASAVWVADEAGPSDIIAGLGMLGGTNHRHLDVYYQRLAAEPPAPPPEPPLVEPPAPPPVEPPVEPPVQPPVEPPVEPLVEPPAEPSGGLTASDWKALLDRLDTIIGLLEQYAARQ